MAGTVATEDVPSNLWEAFDRMVAGQPDAVALVLGEDPVSFAGLREQALRAAAWLAGRDLRRGDVVAIQLPKRRDTYALWLGCLYLGCPYVFMDTRNPASRSEAILSRLRPRLLVSVGATQNPHGLTLRLETPEEGDRWLRALPAASTAPPPAGLHGLDPAYIMFTSGSTGEPKGAVIPHQGVLSLMRWAHRLVPGLRDMRFSNINPLHFDNSVFDLYGGLLNGAALVPVETSQAANPVLWVRRLRDGGANVIFAVPTLFQTLDRLRLLAPDRLPDARIFVFGGEGFPPGPLASFHDRFKGRARLVNVYGPTETSCICSSLEIDDQALAKAGTGFPSLGRMHRDFDHMILDDGETPVPRGDAGELWIGGANVGLGYYNAPEETARRFRQDPRQPHFRSTWYRTGDLVREDADGLLWFVGRVDNQVKIRGHRIELEEIDLAIEAIEGVRRASAVVVSGEDGPELRAAFCAVRPVPLDEVRAHCSQRLPPYMQPARLRQVDALPENANGKIDRRAIASLFQEPS